MINSIFILLILPLSSFSQKLKCEDFKTGNFIMTNEMFPGVEVSIYRGETIQTEIKIADKENITEGNDGMLYEKIEWISECKYKLTFDNSRMKSTELTELINNNGGIITEIISFEENCYLYESSFTLEGKTQKISGRICKDLSY
jgi:hypothetical protein